MWYWFVTPKLPALLLSVTQKSSTYFFSWAPLTQFVFKSIMDAFLIILLPWRYHLTGFSHLWVTCSETNVHMWHGRLATAGGLLILSAATAPIKNKNKQTKTPLATRVFHQSHADELKPGVKILRASLEKYCLSFFFNSLSFSCTFPNSY